MTHKRILLLGTTGLDKSVAVQRLVSTYEEGGHVPPTVLEFEKDFLNEDPDYRDIGSYLQKNLWDQAKLWNAAWDRARTRITALGSQETVILVLHATSVRDYYGVRISACADRISTDFSPTLIVNLGDDVYSMWARTQQRASGHLASGMPTFEQLLMARRVEALVGDLIHRKALERGVRSKHVFLAMGHPVSALANLALRDAYVCYLSFPISAPRELQNSVAHEAMARATTEGIRNFHRQALLFQERYHSVCFVSPLMIDELPFVRRTEQAMEKGEAFFEFDVEALKWDVADLWDDAVVLSESVPRRISGIETVAARNVIGMIRSEVTWRDYRLVLQADALACYSPVMPRVEPGDWRVSGGVSAELDKASETFIPSFVYQPPEFDPTGVWTRPTGSTKTMGSTTRDTYVHTCDSVDSVYKQILKLQHRRGMR